MSHTHHPIHDPLETHLDIITRQLADRSTLYVTDDGTRRAYVTLELNGVWKNIPVQSPEFIRHIQLLYQSSTSRVLSSRMAQDAVQSLTASAEASKLTHKVWLRSADIPQVHAKRKKREIWIDLGWDDWTLVKITTKGWELTNSQSSPKFRRTSAMKPMVKPIGGQSAFHKYLGPLLGIGHHDTPILQLITAWMLQALMPHGPYPILVLASGDGSGKSTTTRLIRSIVDPSSVNTIGFPRDEEKLLLNAVNSRTIAFDNLSSFPSWASDSLCRLSSGGSGVRLRALYQDLAEVISPACVAFILNSIPTVVTAPDLLARSLLVRLPDLSDSRRRTESEINRMLDESAPFILGWLLDAISWSLEQCDEILAYDLPRMADFYKLITICEPALGWTTGSFKDTYYSNRETSASSAIDGSLIGPYLLPLLPISDPISFEDLLRRLNRGVPKRVKDLPSWPDTPHALSTLIHSLEPGLTGIGMAVSYSLKTRRRVHHVQIEPKV